VKWRSATRALVLARGCALLIGVALVALASPAAAQDLLILRDGEQRSGVLDSWISDRCMLGSESVPRSEIAWIGVGVDPESSPPPPPADPGLDAVQLADGALHPAPLVGISATTVVTQRGSHARTEVDWIYLAPPPQETDVTSGQGQPPPSPSEPSVEPPPPPPAPATPGGQPPSAGPPAASPAGVGERGGLWTGTLIARRWSQFPGNQKDVVSRFDLRFREILYPLMDPDPPHRVVGGGAFLQSEGSTVTTRMSRSYHPSERCWGQGTSPLPSAAGSLAYLKSADHYSFATYGLGTDPYPQTC